MITKSTNGKLIAIRNTIVIKVLNEVEKYLENGYRILDSGMSEGITYFHLIKKN